MVRTGRLVFFLLACTALSWSQDPPSHIQVFGGYSYVPTNFSYLGGGENGWNAALDVNARTVKWIGFTADFAEYFSSSPFPPLASDNSKTFTFLFGPRVSVPLGKASKVTPFGHFLIGAAHVSDNYQDFSTSTSFAWAFGGGVDFRLTRHLALRGQADSLRAYFVASDNQLRVPNWHPRLSVGAVFRF
jgi:hypothetical protein